MKIEMVKLPGSVLVAASDTEADKLNKFKTGGQYTAELKLTRNPKFHRKVFSFFNYCYEFWKGQTRYQFACDKTQFNAFRKDLTIRAGFFNDTWDIYGNLHVDAKSLSFANMEQEEFERCYEALINAAMSTIFKGMSDKDYYNELVGFF